MSEKEYKDKCEMMFKRNAVLISENEQLKEQIEQMKMCGNCKHRNNYNFPTPTEPCNKCLRYSKWELKK